MEKRLRKSEIQDEVKKDDLVKVDGTYWIVVDDELELYQETGLLLSDEIPLPKLKELALKWESEDYSDEREWLKKGIFLYTKMLQSKPDNNEYKYILGKLLFENAIHMKRNEFTRKEAKRLFEEVIKLNPHYRKAYLCDYQLGFLNQYEQDWKKAIYHFNHAIESGELDYFQRLRAWCNLGICYGQAGETEQAKQCILMAKEIDKQANRFTPEIEMANLQIQTAVNQYKPYILITKDSAKRITAEEAEDISLDYEENVVLDFRNQRAVFSGPKDSVPLATNYAEMLKLLMTYKSPLPKEALSEELFSITDGMAKVAPGSIKMYIRTIRSKIDPCFNFQDKKESAIATVDQGYKWDTKYPYKIIIPSQRS